MTTKAILHKIINNNTNYCCLCFYSKEDSFFNVEDTVLLDSKTFINLFEILSNVLGENILKSLSTNVICQKCTKNAIKSYKFIKISKNNVLKLAMNVNSLQKYTDAKIETNYNNNTLFIGLNTCSQVVKYIYDKKQYNLNKAMLIKRFNSLLKKDLCPKVLQTNYISIDFKYEPSEVTEEDALVQTPHNHMSPEVNLLNDINYKCKYCVKLYPSYLKLKEHYLRVHASKDFKCSQCPRKFGLLRLLKRHIKDSHCTLVCSHCGKTYNNKYSLRYHERSHKLRLVCPTCGKVYKGKQAFNNHIQEKLCEKMRKTNAEAKFICDFCNKKYSQKAALSIHIRLEHDNGNAFICDWCGKKLSASSKLTEHILTHTQQKNFDCNICGGKFVTKTSLLYHTRTHTGEKPYKCEQCDLKFLSASRRSEHTKRHHGIIDLECDMCHSKFKGQTNLLRHRKRHFNTSSRLYHNVTEKE